MALISISLIILDLGFIYALNAERACLMLEAASFRSFREVGVPFASPPMDRMHPTVSFDEGRANFMVSDMVLSGPYTCQAGQISADLAYDEHIDGQLDPGTGMLVWDGDQYEMVQENRFCRRVSVLFWRTYDKNMSLNFRAWRLLPAQSGTKLDRLSHVRGLNIH